jgi:hypothetical protein
MYRLASSVPARDVTKAGDRIRCTSEAIELVRGARYGVGKRRRAFGGSERGALTCGAGGRAFENRLIARRSSTAAVGAGTADVDDRVKGNGSRLVRCGRDRPPAARASPPARSGKRRGPPALRLSSHRLPKNGKRPPLKSRAPAETAPRQLSETSPPTNETRRPPLDAGALNRRPPAVERAEPYTDSGTRHTSASCYDSNRIVILLISSKFRRRSENRLSYVDASRRGESSAPKSKSPRSRVEAHDTKNHRIDRSLAAKRQTLRGEGRDPVQKTRLVETFPTTPRSPFLPNR